MTTRLTALRPDNPIAWMAACGALRLLPGARLRWDGDTPELSHAGDPVADLAALIPERVAAPEIGFDHKLQVNMSAAAWQDLRALPAEWLLALGAETESGARSTQLRIGAGPQDCVGMVRKMLKRLDKLSDAARSEKIREALLGPWRYEDNRLVGWGWDADARVDAAALDREPGNLPEQLKFGVLAAYWLGWEALPLFPLINRRTLSWNRDSGLSYPTWTEWLDYAELRSVMLSLSRMPVRERDALGIVVRLARYLPTSEKAGRLGWGVPLARTPIDSKKPVGSRKGEPPSLLRG